MFYRGSSVFCVDSCSIGYDKWLVVERCSGLMCYIGCVRCSIGYDRCCIGFVQCSIGFDKCYVVIGDL